MCHVRRSMVCFSYSHLGCHYRCQTFACSPSPSTSLTLFLDYACALKGLEIIMYMFIIMIATFMHESMVDMIALMLANCTNEGRCWWFKGLMASLAWGEVWRPGWTSLHAKNATQRGNIARVGRVIFGTSCSWGLTLIRVGLNMKANGCESLTRMWLLERMKTRKTWEFNHKTWNHLNVVNYMQWKKAVLCKCNA